MLFLGEIGERKGVFDLLKAIYDHADEFQDRIHLAIGGSGDEARMRKKISSFAIAEMVSFEGFVSGEKKASLLREAFFVELPGIFSLFIMQHYMLLGQLHEKASYRASFFVFLEGNDNSTESIILIFGKCILHFSQLHESRL